MSEKNAPTLRRPLLYIGVGCLTGGTLVLELTLTRIFSVIMYYHFSFLAISLALFGLGLAGVVVYLRPRLTDANRLFELLGRYTLYAAGAVPIALIVVLRQRVGVGLGAENLLAVTCIYAAAALPFFFAGVSVTLAVTRMQQEMSRLYFADLIGAASGCLLVVPLLELCGGPSAALAAGVLFLTAHLFFGAASGAAGRRLLPGAALLLLLVTAVAVNSVRPFLSIPSSKETREERVLFSKWNSFSRVTVESAEQKDFSWLRIDSSAATRIFSGELAKEEWEPTRRFSETRVASLVYALGKPGKALVIGPGGGADIIAALSSGQREVVGVEINSIIARDVMQDRFREYSGGLYNRPDVRLLVNDGRSFVRGSDEQFDSIQATLVDTWAATSAGAFTLSENNLYTREAFGDYLRHLTPDGILTMTRWKGDPPREFLRLLVLGRAALDELGIRDHRPHFYVAADGRMATMLLKRSPFTAEEIARLDAYVAEAELRRLYSPQGDDRNPHARLLRAADWRRFVAEHPEDISPPTDDRPFFFYTVKPGRLATAVLEMGKLSRDNLGLVLLAAAFVVIGVLSLLFLVLPLFVWRRDLLVGEAQSKLCYLSYFIAIGLGFITLEMALLQRFVLLLGHPVLSLWAILFSLLVASGIGSLLCRRVTPARTTTLVRRNGLLLLGLVILYIFGLPPLFVELAPVSLALRLLATVLLVTPLGLLLGSFLPLGVVGTAERFRPLVPWAWGLNGAASVLGSVLAVGVAMNVGFRATMLVGLACYGGALLVCGCSRESEKAAAQEGVKEGEVA